MSIKRKFQPLAVTEAFEGWWATIDVLFPNIPIGSLINWRKKRFIGMRQQQKLLRESNQTRIKFLLAMPDFQKFLWFDFIIMYNPGTRTWSCPYVRQSPHCLFQSNTGVTGTTKTYSWTWINGAHFFYFEVETLLNGATIIVKTNQQSLKFMLEQRENGS